MGCGSSARVPESALKSAAADADKGGQKQTSISDQSKELFRAIEKKDLDKVKQTSQGNPDFPHATFMFEPAGPGEPVTLKPGRMEVSLFITACDGENGTPEIVKHFLDAKADVNKETNGKTPLGFACLVSDMLNPDLIQTILDAGPEMTDKINEVQQHRDSRELKKQDGWTEKQVKDAQDRADKVIEAMKRVSDPKEAYKAWKTGSLRQIELEKFQKFPADPETGLLWWQWVEKEEGICDHQPPRDKPAFQAA